MAGKHERNAPVVSPPWPLLMPPQDMEGPGAEPSRFLVLEVDPAGSWASSERLRGVRCDL